MGYYLSERRRNETIYLYACRDWRDLAIRLSHAMNSCAPEAIEQQCLKTANL